MAGLPRIIFHHPLPIVGDGRSGSIVRPSRMLRAFRENGFEVEDVSGFASSRRLTMSRVMRSHEDGKRYEFCYSETSTMPYALTEPHHLPVHGEMDLNFLEGLKARGVPVAVFYRDAQWLLPDYLKSGIQGIARLAAKAVYVRELKRLRAIADVLYVPSSEFAEWLGLPDNRRVRELPPGCEVGRVRRARGDRRYAGLYVGGVTPPIYDPTPFLELASLLPGERFLLVCRDDEWDALQGRVKALANVDRISAASDGLDEAFEDSDTFAIMMGGTEYFSLAMPVKLFDAIGRGIPILAIKGSAAASFIEKEGLGWTVGSAAEAASVISALKTEQGKIELEAVAAGVHAAAQRHTWISRAVQVASDMAEVRKAIA
jgi:hypothetical protein